MGGRGKTTGTSGRSGERPAKDDGQKDSTGAGKVPGQRWQEQGHIRDTYLCDPKRTV